MRFAANNFGTRFAFDIIIARVDIRWFGLKLALFAAILIISVIACAIVTTGLILDIRILFLLFRILATLMQHDN